jgi:hypothetical protein
VSDKTINDRQEVKPLKRSSSAVFKQNRSVIESYNSKANQNKFCIPVTLQTALLFEKSFERDKANKKSILVIKRGSNKKKISLGQDDASKINKVVLKQYGENSRHSSKFIELATKL